VIIAETVSFVSAFDGLGLLSLSLATSDHLRLPVADAHPSARKAVLDT
jgi:hypothetical protein